MFDGELTSFLVSYPGYFISDMGRRLEAIITTVGPVFNCENLKL